MQSAVRSRSDNQEQVAFSQCSFPFSRWAVEFGTPSESVVNELGWSNGVDVWVKGFEFRTNSREIGFHGCWFDEMRHVDNVETESFYCRLLEINAWYHSQTLFVFLCYYLLSTNITFLQHTDIIVYLCFLSFFLSSQLETEVRIHFTLIHLYTFYSLMYLAPALG